jgi:hypothetical protein
MLRLQMASEWRHRTCKVCAFALGGLNFRRYLIEIVGFFRFSLTSDTAGSLTVETEWRRDRDSNLVTNSNLNNLLERVAAYTAD